MLGQKDDSKEQTVQLLEKNMFLGENQPRVSYL